MRLAAWLARALLIVGLSQQATGCGDSDAGGRGSETADGGGPDRNDGAVSQGPHDLDAQVQLDAASAHSARDAEAVARDATVAADAGAPSTRPVVADPWQPIARDRVASECKLDPELLDQADLTLNTPWAVVRYGKLCHVFGDPSTPSEAWSATKTLGALVTGMVAYETRSLPNVGHKTGPFSDEDRVDQWLEPSAITYNKEAHVAHVLAMVAQNADLSQGQKSMSYDVIGTVQINTLSDMLNAAIQQDSSRLGADLEQFTQQFLFKRIGMLNSFWSDDKPDKVFGATWNASLLDMARVGLLLLRGGTWQGERVLSEDWVYRMTHPAFEDSSTGYGYLTWLNARNNYGFSVLDMQIPSLGVPIMPGPCAPVSIYNRHPHGLSTVSDCGYGVGFSCDQTFDVGVWQAVGLYGQIIQGHPGLDLVVVGKNLAPTLEISPAANGAGKVWDALRPALIAGDPVYGHDPAGFCSAYGANAYAPDLMP